MSSTARAASARAKAGWASPIWCSFAGGYLDDAALAGWSARPTSSCLPYDSREQVTSGVLVEAVAAGKPVVATAFPHAVELLAGGPGIARAAPRPGGAIGDALHRILTDPGSAAGWPRGPPARAGRCSGAAVAGDVPALADRLLGDVARPRSTAHRRAVGVTSTPYPDRTSTTCCG